MFDSFSSFFGPGAELFRPRGREALATPFQIFFGVFEGEAFSTPVEGQRIVPKLMPQKQQHKIVQGTIL